MDRRRLLKGAMLGAAWDVRAGNYMGGRLIDFSQACTAPHIELDWNSELFSPGLVKECATKDMVDFDL